MGSLENKVALITGGASGIGLATASLFAREGAAIVLGDVDANGLSSAEQNLRTKGAEIRIHAGDISSAPVAGQLVEKAIANYGRIDVLFNNAGIDFRGSIEETAEDDWDKIIRVNLKSVFLLTKYVVPHMLGAGSGSIINTSSAVALYPVANRAAYCASKGAIVALTKALALDLAPQHVRVNCICPGAVDTPLLRESFSSAADPDAARSSVIARYPLGRLAEADEIARVALFLASSDSSFMTGATLAVDGGRTMH